MSFKRDWQKADNCEFDRYSWIMAIAIITAVFFFLWGWSVSSGTF